MQALEHGVREPTLLPAYFNSLAAASISSALARTRISSVKFTQRTTPEESTRNSAGREISLPSGPPPLCSRLYRRIVSALGSERMGKVYPVLLASLRDCSGLSTLMATGRTPAASNSFRFFWMPRNSRLQNGHHQPR